MEALFNTIKILGLVAALIFAGNGDYEQEQAENEQYCKMVQAGLWGVDDDSVECE